MREACAAIEATVVALAPQVRREGLLLARPDRARASR